MLCSHATQLFGVCVRMVLALKSPGMLCGVTLKCFMSVDLHSLIMDRK